MHDVAAFGALTAQHMGMPFKLLLRSTLSLPNIIHIGETIVRVFSCPAVDVAVICYLQSQSNLRVKPYQTVRPRQVFQARDQVSINSISFGKILADPRQAGGCLTMCQLDLLISFKMPR